MTLQRPLELPCGAILKNRLIKSAMSDSLGDGYGNPTQTQIRLYERWAQGGVAVSIIGEVQVDPRYPERPGNLVLDGNSNLDMLREFTRRATINSAHLWPQLGHAGALSYNSISQPKGPSAINMDSLQCNGMTSAEIQALPRIYANAALRAKSTGFTGVHIHAGHGFLLSQFLSPLFNKRVDNYGGDIMSRARIILEIIREIREVVGASFPIGIRINATDQVEGGLTETDALDIVHLLKQTSIDLIDISGGTYFPGAKSSSDSRNRAPYFLDFARRAKTATSIPIMVTGGFKRREQVVKALASGASDAVGLARAMVLDPALANTWLSEAAGDPDFPMFNNAVAGGITAWYTMRLTALGNDREKMYQLDIPTAMKLYEDRDTRRAAQWRQRFSSEAY